MTFQETGPRGRSCTCNLPVLSGAPLAGWATRGWCPRSDLHRHWARFKCAVSTLDYVGFWRSANIGAAWRIRTSNLPVLSGMPLLVGLTRRKWHSRQDSHLHLRRSKRRALVIKLREQKSKRAESEGRGAHAAHRRRALSTIFQSDFSPSRVEPTGRFALPWGYVPGSLRDCCCRC